MKIWLYFLDELCWRCLRSSEICEAGTEVLHFLTTDMEVCDDEADDEESDDEQLGHFSRFRWSLCLGQRCWDGSGWLDEGVEESDGGFDLVYWYGKVRKLAVQSESEPTSVYPEGSFETPKSRWGSEERRVQTLGPPEGRGNGLPKGRRRKRETRGGELGPYIVNLMQTCPVKR